MFSLNFSLKSLILASLVQSQGCEIFGKLDNPPQFLTLIKRHITSVWHQDLAGRDSSLLLPFLPCVPLDLLSVSFPDAETVSCWPLSRLSWCQAESGWLPRVLKLALFVQWPPDRLRNVVEGIWLVVKGRLVRIQPVTYMTLDKLLPINHWLTVPCLPHQKTGTNRTDGGSLLGLLWLVWVETA